MKIEELRQYLKYDPETGNFYWRKKTSNNKRVPGDLAGCVTPRGYIVIGLFNKNYMAHRLAWAFTHNKWPECYIDHIDRNPSNNKLNNLREADYSENGMNHSPMSTCKSGVRGVCWDRTRNKWEVRITVRGNTKFVGRFDDFEIAVKNRVASELKYFGEFSPNSKLDSVEDV